MRSSLNAICEALTAVGKFTPDGENGCHIARTRGIPQAISTIIHYSVLLLVQ
jgi:hypothetical protein